MPASKNLGGRPPVLDGEKIRIIEQVFSLGGSDRMACLQAGVCLATLYNYQKRNPEFVERKELLKEKMALAALKNVADHINGNENEGIKPCKDTARWYLERKMKDEFSVRQEVTGKDGEALTPPTINIVPVAVSGESDRYDD